MNRFKMKNIKKIKYAPQKCLKHHNKNCKISKHKCDICGNNNANLVIDPYDYEINKIIEERYLCDSCYQNRFDDI